MEKSAADVYHEGMSAFARQDLATALDVLTQAAALEPAFLSMLYQRKGMIAEAEQEKAAALKLQRRR